MKKILMLCLLIITATFIYSQTRDDVKIYIQPTMMGTPAENAFFDKLFLMELNGANYATAPTNEEADYRIELAVVHEEDYAGIYNAIKVVLFNAKDNTEIVAFEAEWETLEDVYEYSLATMYQAMANVPMTKLKGEIATDWWRNKWFYFSPYIIFSPHFYDYDSWALTIPMNEGAMFGGGLDFEVQFLDWASLETGFELHFDQISKWDMSNGDPKGTFTDEFYYTPVIQIPLLFKIAFKPSTNWMIQPYLGIGLNMALNRSDVNIPMATALAGAQFAVEATVRGGVFVDIRLGYDIGKVRTELQNFHRMYAHLGVGYKLGFEDRIKNELNTEQAPKEDKTVSTYLIE
jgi:hypothetical protein